MYDFGRNPYQGITSMHDVRCFTEAVVILSIDELVGMIPDQILSLIPPQDNKNFLIHVPGQMRPAYCFSNKDRIFERIGGAFRQVKLEDAYERRDLYLEVKDATGINGYAEGIFHFNLLFGNKFSWVPEVDKRLISLAAQVVILELADVMSETPATGPHILSKEAITNYLSYDLWREYQVDRGVVLGEDSFEVFNKEVIDVFRYLPDDARDLLHDAGMRYADCGACVDVIGSGLRIEFSIDKKLVPYYEKKFGETY